MTGSVPRKYEGGFFWKIWVSVIGTILAFQFAFGGGLQFHVSERPSLGVPFTIFSVAQFLAISVIRWVVIPRTKERRDKILLIAISLGLCEALEFYGVFLFGNDASRTKVLLFALSLAGAIQFIPHNASYNEKG